MRVLLWLCVGVLLLCALAVVAAAAATTHHRGARWWVAALLSAAGGLGLAAAGAGSYWAWFPIHSLVAQWALLCLIGIRRFHARLALPGNHNVDMAVLWAGLTCLALAETLLPAGPQRELCAVLVALMMQLYPAIVLLRCAEHFDRPVLHGLGLVIGVAALAPQAMALTGRSVSVVWHASAAAVVPASMLMTMVVVMLLLRRQARARGQAPGALPTAFLTSSFLSSYPSMFYDLARHRLEIEAGGQGTLVIVGTRDERPAHAPPSSAEFEKATARLTRCSRDVVRAEDIAGEPELGTVALLLPSAKPADVVAITQRIATRWQTQADAKIWPGTKLVFGLSEAGPDEDIDHVVRRAMEALGEARRQRRADVVSATGPAAQRVYTRHGHENRRAA